MPGAIIVDDEASGVETLKKDLAKYCPEITIMGVAHSADEAEEKIKSLKPGLVFLDVEMPYASGFDLLARFKEINFEVIFTTAYNEYAIKAIKNNALDYLLKPIHPDELVAAVKKYLTKSAKEPKVEIKIENLVAAMAQLQKVQKLPVPTVDGVLYIDTTEITRLEGSHNYTNIHLVGGKKILSSKTLKDYEQLLTAQNFFRVHKTHLINLNHTVKYLKGEGGYVLMTDGASVEVSRQKKQELLSLLSQ